VGTSDKEVLNRSRATCWRFVTISPHLDPRRNAWTFTGAQQNFFDAFSAPQTWRDVQQAVVSKPKETDYWQGPGISSLVLALGGCAITRRTTYSAMVMTGKKKET